MTSRPKEAEKPRILAVDDPMRDAVTVHVGRERVSISGQALRFGAYGGGMEWVMSDLYDAAARGVRASLSPLERPHPRVIRSTKGSRLAYPLHPGCSQARLHGR